jgi:hypothetical protein
MKTLHERARRLLAGQRESALSSGEILVPFHCGALRHPFTVVARRDGHSLFILRNLSESGGGTAGPGLGGNPLGLGVTPLGQVTDIRMAPNWRCPHCGAGSTGKVAYWSCGSCESAGRPSLNCGGADRQGLYHCACGISTREFVDLDTVAIHGLAPERLSAQSTSPLLGGDIPSNRRLLT